MNPLIVISFSSKLEVPVFLLSWRICAHRTTAGPEVFGKELLRPSLAADVVKARRHVCIAYMELEDD